MRRSSEVRGDESEVPGPGTPLPSPEFVGRQAELAAIGAALDDPPAVILIEGEAGIGKSRLVRELLAAQASDERPLSGRSNRARSHALTAAASGDQL